MARCRVLWAALGIAVALGCRKSNDPARIDPPATSPAPSAAVAEPPPTEAEAVPEIRAVMEKAAREGIHMRFWRLGAGTPGPDGWVSASPTGGGFEIELPVPFNDFQQTGPATDGVPIETRTVGGPWAGGKVSCSRIRRTDGSPSPVPKRSMRDDWLAKPDTLSARDRTWEGFPAVEVEAKSAEMHAQLLMVDAGPGGTFIVTVELPEAAWAAHRAEVDRVVRSLKTKLAPPGRQ
jgi:hypothetical protein